MSNGSATMSASSTGQDLQNQQQQPKPGLNNSNVVYIRLQPTKKLLFILGVLFGTCFVRYDFLKSVYDKSVEVIRGYEYDPDGDCIVMRKKKGDKYCRAVVNCSMCHSVSGIDIVEASEMTRDMFVNRYAYRGQPVVVRNATDDWLAMDTFDFDFFRDLYEDLQSPVLDNLDDDCQFFAWDFDEFSNMQEVFDMDENRIRMKGNYEPWYIGWANCDSVAVEELREHYKRPWFIPVESEVGRRDWFFMGTPGFGAPFHLDEVKYPSWQAQIRGRKKWSLRVPPECWWSCPSSKYDMSVILQPGDVIVVNTNWWFHATNVEGDELSVTITNEYT